MHLNLFSNNDDSGSRMTSGQIWTRLSIVILAALSVWILIRTVFFVDETEYVYVTQFGQPMQLYTEPGLAVKWPYQSLWRFDRRLQMYEPPGREMLTEDKENLNFQWFVCWRIPGRDFTLSSSATSTRAIGDSSAKQSPSSIETYVRRFLEAVGTMEIAENRLEERVQAAVAAEIGRTQMAQLVSLDAEQLQLDAISTRVTMSLRDIAAKQFGIEVVDVRVKRFNYPDAVKPAVYAEIRSERERVAVQYRAEGAGQKAKIESLADLQRDQLLAQAKREATVIRGEGEAQAIATYNAAHRKDPQFYELLKTLETYRTILDDQTTVVLSADSPLLKLLTRGLPSLENPPTSVPGQAPAAQSPSTAGDGLDHPNANPVLIEPGGSP